MSLSQDKQGRATKTNNVGTIDAVLETFLNGCGQTHINWPTGDDITTRPTDHTFFDFVVRKAPNSTDYSDSNAPIGSKFTQIEDDGTTAVVRAREIAKTASNVYQSVTTNITEVDGLGGTPLVDGAVTSSKSITIDGILPTIGVISAGALVTHSGSDYTVIENAAIASNEVTLSLDSEITASDGDAVTIALNVQPTDTIIRVDSTAATVSALGLPAAAQCKGNVMTFISANDSSTNTITIDGNGAETIEGSATQVLDAQYESITIVSDGTEWFILTNNR